MESSLMISVSSRPRVLLLLATSLAYLLISISGVLPGGGLGVVVDVITVKYFDNSCIGGNVTKLTTCQFLHQTSCPSLEEDCPCHPPS